MEVQFYPNNGCSIEGGANGQRPKGELQQTILHEQPVTGNRRASLQQSLGRYKSKTEDEIEQAQTVVVAMETREPSWSGLIQCRGKSGNKVELCYF